MWPNPQFPVDSCGHMKFLMENFIFCAVPNAILLFLHSCITPSTYENFESVFEVNWGKQKFGDLQVCFIWAIEWIFADLRYFLWIILQICIFHSSAKDSHPKNVVKMQEKLLSWISLSLANCNFSISGKSMLKSSGTMQVRKTF